jgi:hypothetical protein
MKNKYHFKIEDNIPMGLKQRQSPFLILYDMLPGQSFLLNNKSQASSAYSYARHHKIKIATRKEGGSFRVWKLDSESNQVDEVLNGSRSKYKGMNLRKSRD